MKTYLVGGAVRDILLDVVPKDRDYVVVGSSPEEMLASGFTQVGADFPVFIHPVTGDEYALARTERKTGSGYGGFDTYAGKDVSLEDDLLRRDLTINSIAMDIDTREIIDPFGGVSDLRKCILRATSDAFREDPLRVLRVGRFLARFPEFEADDTLYDICDSMTEELASLTPERVWQEVSKALEDSAASRFFTFMAGRNVFPEIDALMDVEQCERWHPEGDAFVHTMMVLDKTRYYDKLTRFGALCHDLGKAPTYKEHGNLHGHEAAGLPVIDAMCDRLKIPNEYRRVAKVVSKWHTHIHKCIYMRPATVHGAIKGAGRDFFRLLDAATADKMGRGEPCCDWSYIQPAYMALCYRNVLKVDRKAITDNMVPGPKVGEAIRVAEINAIRAVDKSAFTNTKGDN